MPYDYLEDERKGTQQTRWSCPDCHREFLWVAHGQDCVSEWNSRNCPACGSPEIQRIRFNGLFDSSTPMEDVARVMLSAEQEAAEAQVRARQIGIAEAPPVPKTLMPDAPEPVLVAAGWAPEFD